MLANAWAWILGHSVWLFGVVLPAVVLAALGIPWSRKAGTWRERIKAWVKPVVIVGCTVAIATFGLFQSEGQDTVNNQITTDLRESLAIANELVDHLRTTHTSVLRTQLQIAEQDKRAVLVAKETIELEHLSHKAELRAQALIMRMEGFNLEIKTTPANPMQLQQGDSIILDNARVLLEELNKFKALLEIRSVTKDTTVIDHFEQLRSELADKITSGRYAHPSPTPYELSGRTVSLTKAAYSFRELLASTITAIKRGNVADQEYEITVRLETLRTQLPEK